MTDLGSLSINDALREKLNAVVSDYVCGLSEGDSVLDEMNGVINAAEACYGEAIIAFVLALLEARNKGAADFSDGKIRTYIDACGRDFDMNLKHNIMVACRDRGLPNPLDPNAKLRDELLNRG